MRSILALIAIVGARADPPSVSDTLAKVCDIFDTMADQHKDLSPEKMKSLGAEFAGLFAENVDCSEDPYNPIIGFDIHGKDFGKCMTAKSEALTKGHAAFEMKEVKCIEKIPDDADKSGALWLEFSNTGKFMSKFTVRAAVRYHFDDNGLIKAYHAVYDSYHLLNKGSGIKATLNQVCDIFDKMADQHKDLSPDKMKSLGAQFAGLFADEVDCSEDPYNPIIGFDIHGEKFGKCMTAKSEALTKGHAAFEMKEVKCIEAIPDEADNTGALWLEFSNTGKFKSKFTVRAAVRYHFNDKGLISAYHAVYDSYHLLNGNKDSRLESAVTISELGKTGFPSVVVSAMALVGIFAFGILVGRRYDSKRYVTLQDEDRA